MCLVEQRIASNVTSLIFVARVQVNRCQVSGLDDVDCHVPTVRQFMSESERRSVELLTGRPEPRFHIC